MDDDDIDGDGDGDGTMDEVGLGLVVIVVGFDCCCWESVELYLDPMESFDRVDADRSRESKEAEEGEGPEELVCWLERWGRCKVWDTGDTWLAPSAILSKFIPPCSTKVTSLFPFFGFLTGTLSNNAWSILTFPFLSNLICLGNSSNSQGIWDICLTLVLGKFAGRGGRWEEEVEVEPKEDRVEVGWSLFPLWADEELIVVAKVEVL